MTRVEFVLTFPGRSYAVGKHLGIVRHLKDDEAARLFDGKTEASWTHRWSDGWTALVTVHPIPRGGKPPRSDGFYGYDWMVENILRYGATRPPKQP